jgi:hypothetical protein
VVWVRWWWWWAASFANAKRGRGLRGKSPKLERAGSVLGASLETEEGIDAGRWWGGVDEVAAAAWSCVQQHEAGEGVGAKNSKLSHCGSVSGCMRAASHKEGFCGVTAPLPQ